MTTSDFARFLSVADVAEILGVSVLSVRSLIDSGELASIRVGDTGPIRIDTAELEAFIAHRYEAEQRVLRLRQAEFSNVADFSDGRVI
jgi:excisionase family DNA binding protein